MASQKQLIQERINHSGVMNLEGLSWRALTSFFGQEVNFREYQPEGWNGNRKWMWFNLGGGFWQIYARNEETALSELVAFCTTKHPNKFMEEAGEH